MNRKVVRVIDLLASFFLTGIFLLLVIGLYLFSMFRRGPGKAIKEVKQLYISILDFREAVISNYKADILLDGFTKKAFCYHFDFAKPKDEFDRIDENIYMSNISVHPDNKLTQAGFTKTMACLVGIKTFFRMLKTARRERVNIIRAHDAHLLGFNACALSGILKIPFIVQICSNYEVKDRQAKGITFRPFIFKSVERLVERNIMKRADMVMTDREHYRAFGLIPNDIPEERYGNIGFFVNEAHYAPLESRKNLKGALGIGDDKKVLLYVGRLCEVKYPLDLLKMLRACLERRKDIVLLVAGDGVLKNDMEKYIKNNGMEQYVMFLNRLSQEELKDLYHTADVACFTSAGFTMIEAALAGKCIVTYDFEWHSEFTGDNERGILVPFGDHNKFAEEVLNVLGDEGRRRRLGLAARSYAMENYTRETAVEKEKNFYRNIFKRRGYAIEEIV